MSPMRRRLGLLIALAVTLLSFTGIPGPPAAHAADPLLSQGRPVTVSSTEAPFAGAHAVDGDPGTRWSSAFADPQWIQVDLGGSARISEVALNWEAAYAKAFQVQVSADARTWSTVHETTTGTGGNQRLTVSGTGRYVRVHGGGDWPGPPDASTPFPAKMLVDYVRVYR